MDISIRVCKKCDGALFTPSGRCRQCLRAAGKKYRATHIEKELARVNTWAKNNPEKIKAKNAIYLDKNKELISSKRRDYLGKNKEQTKAQWAAYSENNREKLNAGSRAWAIANPERVKANRDAWAAANPEARRVVRQNRRARTKVANGRLSKNIIQSLLALQGGKCPCCRLPLGDDFEMDHIIPLALGGSNTDENIQLLRSICNRQKSAKHPVDFMQSRGFLL